MRIKVQDPRLPITDISSRMPTKTESQSDRHASIREILQKGSVDSQAKLLQELRIRGFRVTQSSISRDLAELHIAKVDGRYLLLSNLPQEIVHKNHELLSVRSVRPAGPHLLMIHTPAGRAGAVGAAIDLARWPEVVGTIAGDDTVMVATVGRSQQVQLTKRFAQFLKESSNA